MLRALLYAAVASIATNAAAQSATSASPNPAVGLTYQSAFETYKPHQEQPVADWRTVNEDVARAGGHVGIFGGASGLGRHPGTTTSAAPGQQSPARGAPEGPGGAGHAGRH